MAGPARIAMTRTSLSTRLLLPLLAAVAGVMSVYAVLAIRQRVETLTAEAQRETHAYAVALGLAIDAAFRDPYQRDVQEIIDRLTRERTIYGVLVYGPAGDVLFRSEPLSAVDGLPVDTLRPVLDFGRPIALERTLRGQRVFSVVRPVADPLGVPLGAFEVAQPLLFLEAEIQRTRQRFLLNTLTLVLAITILSLWLVQRLVARPLGRFVEGARALGRGEFGHRIAGGGPAELAALAEAFNGMADRLERARADLLREAEGRVRLERRLRESEKLAAVGNVAAGLAHEIGAPLNVIRGRAERLLTADASPAERRSLRIIVEQIDRITRSVRELLDFARRREPRLEVTDLAAVVRGVAEFLEPELERNGAIFTWSGPAAVWVRADGNLLHHVFTNLFLNALHALADAPPPRRVHARVHDAGPAAVVTCDWGPAGPPDTDGDVVILDVTDTGHGVATAFRDRVFEPFVTTKPSGEGTGLGLAVARSIIEDHGGRIALLPADGSGTTFRIALPAAPVPEPAHA